MSNEKICYCASCDSFPTTSWPVAKCEWFGERHALDRACVLHNDVGPGERSRRRPMVAELLKQESEK